MYAPPPRLNLLVLRSKNIDAAKEFYSCLGFLFGSEKHGNGPMHYVYAAHSLVFEIYPLRENSNPTRGVRIGFEIDTIDEYIPELLKLGGKVLTEPYDSEIGRHAVIEDLDGHIIELTCSENIQM